MQGSFDMHVGWNPARFLKLAHVSPMHHCQDEMFMKAMKKNDSAEKQSDLYIFDINDISNLTGRVFLKNDVKYRNKSPSNRHRGLTPMMVAILMLIHKASKIAENRGQEFIGLTLYDCQKAFVFCGISNETVRDNIKRLIGMGFIRKVIVARRDKKKIIKMAYHVIDKYKFPCKDGTWLLTNAGEGGQYFIPIHCVFYPFCSLSPVDCKIIDNFMMERKILTNNEYNPEGKDSFIDMLKKRLTEWTDDFKEMERLSRDFFDLLATSIYQSSFFSEAINAEDKEYLTWELVVARKEGRYDDKLAEIRDVIIKHQKKIRETEARHKARRRNSDQDDVIDDDFVNMGTDA